MKIHRLALTGVFVFTALSSFLPLTGQTGDCKVLIPEISGTYAGGCKKGLAHGKGLATGIDSYEGQFIKGLPHGKGTYTWANGMVYRGEWSKGLQDGEGELVHITSRGDSIVKGFWKGGAYVGEKIIPAYLVIRKDNLLNCSFRRLGDGNEVIVRFMMKGQINSRVRGMTMSFNNGSQFKSGTFEGVQNVSFPFDLKIIYTTSNPISRSTFEVVFECAINEPGKWEVILNN